MASRAYAEGDLIARVKGRLVRNDPARPFASDVGPNWFGIAPGVWIDPLPPFDFLNHSCTPNAAIERRAEVRALEEIPEGTEISIDYSTTESDPDWQMKCCCLSPSCRGELLAIQFAFTDRSKPPKAPPAMLRVWRRSLASMKQQKQRS